MKFAFAVAAFLSLILTVVADPCELCSDFNDNLPIDMSKLFDTTGPLQRHVRTLQEDGEFEMTSCAQIPLMLGLMGDDVDAGTCGWVGLIATMFCGCEGLCARCPDGSAYPDLDAAPNYEILADMEMEMDSFGTPGTCRDLSTQMSAAIFLVAVTPGKMDLVGTTAPSEPDVDMDPDTVVTAAPSEPDVDMNLDAVVTAAPSEFFEGNIESMFCGVVGAACGCPAGGCPICEFGLDNPDFVVNVEEESFTCLEGVERLQMMGSMGLCDQAKSMLEMSGCICKEAGTDTVATVESPKDTLEENPSSTSDLRVESTSGAVGVRAQTTFGLGNWLIIVLAILSPTFCY